MYHCLCFNYYCRDSTSSTAWLCPVCNLHTRKADLIFDCFFDRILTANKDTNADISGLSVEIFADATWKLMEDKKKYNACSNTEATVKLSAVIDDAQEVYDMESDCDNLTPIISLNMGMTNAMGTADEPIEL